MEPVSDTDKARWLEQEEQELRLRALEQAVHHAAPHTRHAEVVEAAKAFHKFLKEG